MIPVYQEPDWDQLMYQLRLATGNPFHIRRLSDMDEKSLYRLERRADDVPVSTRKYRHEMIEWLKRCIAARKILPED